MFCFPSRTYLSEQKSEFNFYIRSSPLVERKLCVFQKTSEMVGRTLSRLRAEEEQQKLLGSTWAAPKSFLFSRNTSNQKVN